MSDPSQPLRAPTAPGDSQFAPMDVSDEAEVSAVLPTFPNDSAEPGENGSTDCNGNSNSNFPTAIPSLSWDELIRRGPEYAGTWLKAYIGPMGRRQVCSYCFMPQL